MYMGEKCPAGFLAAMNTNKNRACQNKGMGEGSEVKWTRSKKFLSNNDFLQ